MTTFYTNIEVRGNNILYRGYENGIPVHTKIPYTPHLFIPTTEETPYKVFGSNVPVKKKTFDSISDMNSFVQEHGDIQNFSVYGCKNIVRQFTGNHFRGDVAWDYNAVKIWFWDIETETNNGFPHPDKAEEPILLITMMEHNSRQVHLWSTRPISDTNEIYTKYPSIDVLVFDSEEAMLKDFIAFFATTRIDILSGWNSMFFDMPYVVNRIKNVLGEEFVNYLSPWKFVRERKIVRDDESVAVVHNIFGVTHLDYLEIYQKFNPGSKESFKLDYIADYELGERKVELPGESFKENYENHWETFVLYNVVDVELLHKLELKMLQVRLAMQLGYTAKCQFGDVVSAMRLWESIIYNYFLDENIVEEFDKPHNEKHKIVGAYVHEPVPGKYGWTVSIDATSLYPSIIMQNNISPECIVDYIDMSMDNVLSGKHINSVPDGCILSANGLVTSKEKTGFIPILIKRMFDLRKQTKNKMLELKRIHAPEEEYRALDVAQLAFKTAANSFYGIMGLAYFKYYDYRMAEAVTSTGQVFIKTTKLVADKFLAALSKNSTDKAMYLDTDSVYFSVQSFVEQHCKGMSDENIVNKLEALVVDVISPPLNKKLSAFASTMGIDDCKINFKLECIGPSIIFVAKKRYAFDILYTEGVRYDKPKMKVMGIEIVRSSTPSVVKDFLKDSLKLCLSGTEKDLHEKVREVRRIFFSCVYKDISFPRGINGMSTYCCSTSIYKPKTPMQVRGALLYNHHIIKRGLDKKYPLIKDGDKIKYVALKMPNTIHENVIAFPSSTIPHELDLERFVDYTTQFDKSFLTPLQKITTCIGWDVEERVMLEF